MATVFFPSCKAKADYPYASEQLAKYLKEKLGIEPYICCRVGRKTLKPEDTALVVCNNCAAILEESSDTDHIDFVWDIIDSDPDFPFPDYRGEEMAIQDCWKAVDKRQVMETVRSLMRKMNIVPVELEENFEKTRFCGADLLKPLNPSNVQLAPRRYTEQVAGVHTPMEEEERLAFLKAHCDKIPTERVATYCKFCKDGIDLGGKVGLHLIQLLFPEA